MMNSVFNKRYGRENVIALWSEEQLSTFALTELTTLKSLAEREMREDTSFQNTCKRLIKRINYVLKEKEKSTGEGH